MKSILGLVAALCMLTIAVATPAVAVDNSISALCRADNAGSTYQRPGGFCEAVAVNKSMVGQSGDKRPDCAAGEELNPAPPPKCIPSTI
jgi:hypothetical protein